MYFNQRKGVKAFKTCGAKNSIKNKIRNIILIDLASISNVMHNYLLLLHLLFFLSNSFSTVLSNAIAFMHRMRSGRHMLGYKAESPLPIHARYLSNSSNASPVALGSVFKPQFDYVGKDSRIMIMKVKRCTNHTKSKKIACIAEVVALCNQTPLMSTMNSSYP